MFRPKESASTSLSTQKIASQEKHYVSKTNEHFETDISDYPTTFFVFSSNIVQCRTAIIIVTIKVPKTMDGVHIILPRCVARL
jgi:hypothetical protein